VFGLSAAKPFQLGAQAIVQIERCDLRLFVERVQRLNDSRSKNEPKMTSNTRVLLDLLAAFDRHGQLQPFVTASSPLNFKTEG
jgi:hypothetical protein